MIPASQATSVSITMSRNSLIHPVIQHKVSLVRRLTLTAGADVLSHHEDEAFFVSPFLFLYDQVSPWSIEPVYEPFVDGIIES